MTTFFELLSSTNVAKRDSDTRPGGGKSGLDRDSLGTIGGNLCHNEPGAICRRCFWRSMPPSSCAAADARKIPLTEFFRGFFETAVASEEILSRWRFRLCSGPRMPLISNIRSARKISLSPVSPLCLSRTKKTPTSA